MQVDRNVEGFRRGEDVPEFRVVEVFAQGVGVQDRAFQTQLADTPLELLRAFPRILRRHCRKSRVTVGVLLDGFRQLIVAGDRNRHRGRGVEHLHTGGGERQDLLVDAARVHVVKAGLTELLQALDDELRPRTLATEVEAPQALETRVVERILGQHAAVEIQHLTRRPRLLGRDSQVARPVARVSGCHTVCPCRRSSGQVSDCCRR